MKLLSAIGGGLAGAIAVTLIHEIVKRVESDAPRMDLLGMDALSKILKHSDQPVPESDTLFKATLAGDIISNAAYYSFAVASNKKIWTRGSLLGLAAGIGAVVLPKYLGLNPVYSNKTAKTKVITTSLYLAGGIIASAVAKSLDSK
ncbi:hypothetical protein BDE36_4014 [Arcticibacter tournemirensis]|uniref:DUF1440 domain-containing protein n=1 Tax=Arcticibacter tournemirensis TaxID=699437 RepID=A0A4Q0MD82_9SPHI|nr:hypothetical protein [Arcticibacter tournemirensis]KAA8481881.1 hypothetical protein F1649_13265 [Arcticibacter tournemirensis]RXF71184.1 hypothetical protein EKH83_05675 [Arcticibacter tournemirensis]TQM52211.1 hypothetical protein BDE36_4014 [Arcticibacter tournemirensis]